jgi:hypothetical protein
MLVSVCIVNGRDLYVLVPTDDPVLRDVKLRSCVGQKLFLAWSPTVMLPYGVHFL